MGKLFLASIFVFLVCISVHSQTSPKCPDFSIGSQFSISEDDGVIESQIIREKEQFVGYFTFFIATTDVNNYPNTFKYKWSLSGNIPFISTRPNEISVTLRNYQQTPENIKVSVEVTELPENCQKNFSKNFKLRFVAQNSGSPVQLENYENLSLKEERKRLDKAVEYYLNSRKESSELCLQIIVYAKSQKALSEKIRFISNYLTTKNHIPRKEFTITGDTDQKNKVLILLFGSTCPLNTSQ